MMNRSGIETYELLRLDEVALAAVPDISKCNERDILQAIGFTQKGDRSLKEKAAIGREGSKQLEAARNREGLENFDGRDFR